MEFKLSVSCDGLGEARTVGVELIEVAQLLRRAAERIERGETDFALRVNDDVVGHARFVNFD